ncbi:MAG: WYL domain-containing protein, partial [Micrococcales bacterium]|nr:WYL domain-containing protein [Micrococcales bacterium]
YELPADIEFTPAELALLNLAGGVWSESSLSADARSGLRKIRALGIPVEDPILGYSPRISLREPSFAPLQRAIEDSRIVSFRYMRPGSAAPRVRRLQPLALVEFEARWHVYGLDLDLDAPRTFLLTRIIDDVVITRTAGDPALREGAGERALEGLRELAARQRALLEIDPGTEAWLRLSRRAEPAAQGYWVPYVDLHVFADELASYGPEVRVVEPDEVRSEVISRLRAVRNAHAGAVQ